MPARITNASAATSATDNVVSAQHVAAKLKFKKPSRVFRHLYDPPTVVISLLEVDKANDPATNLKPPENNVEPSCDVIPLADQYGSRLIAA